MNSRYFYYFLAILTGGVTLILELLFTRLISIYFGNSLINWSLVLSMVMSGMATGYFLGAMIAVKTNKQYYLYYSFFILSGFIAISPLIYHYIMEYFYYVSSGNFFSCLFIIFPPMVILGTIAPVVIGIETKDIKSSGRFAGNFLALSSVSGIVAVFLIGYFILERLGTVNLLILTSLILNFVICITFILQKKYSSLIIFFLIVVLCSISYQNQKKLFGMTGKNIQYAKEGIQGQVIIEDSIGKSVKKRILYIDHLPQTIVSPYTLISDYNYVHKISSLSSIYPEGSDALAIGIGGGSSVLEFLRLGFKVDAVELDNNIIEISKKYFGLKEYNVTYINDDARHYLNICRKTYKMILIDIISGEFAPSHVFSVESLTKAIKLLDKDGTMYIYFFGSLSGKGSESLLSLVSTIKSSGLEVTLFAERSTPTGMKILRLCKLKKPEDFKLERINTCCRKYLFDFQKINTESLSDAEILRDDKPILDILFQKSLPEYKARAYYWKIGNRKN